MERNYEEPRYYGLARCVNEKMPKPVLTGLEELSEQDLSSIYSAARKVDNAGILKLVNSEEKRRYISMVMGWYRKICRRAPKTQEERLKFLEKANEIFRRGWNDYHDELISVWQYIEEVADEISEKLPDCTITERYKVSKSLMKELFRKKVEDMQGLK